MKPGDSSILLWRKIALSHITGVDGGVICCLCTIRIILRQKSVGTRGPTGRPVTLNLYRTILHDEYDAYQELVDTVEPQLDTISRNTCPGSILGWIA